MVRNAYLKRIEEKLEDWDDEIARIKEKAEKAQGDARSLYDEQLKVLRAKQKVARERLQEVRDAGAESWGKFKSGVETALDDLKKAVDTAVSKLRKSA